MSQADRHQIPEKRWTTAGAVIVFLAAALLGFAIYFAAGQSRALALLRISAAQREALQLRVTATERIRRIAGRMLSQAIDRFHAGDRADPFAGRRGTRWLGDLYLWDAQSLTRWPAADEVGTIPAPDPAMEELIAARLRHRLADVTPQSESAVTFITDVFRGRPVVLASRGRGVGTRGVVLAAVRLDLDRLLHDDLEQHFAASGRLSIVREADIHRTFWVTPLSDALPLLIVPSDKFVAGEQQAAFVRIIVFVAVGVLFLVVLIVLIVKLIRLVRREVALSRLKSNFVADVSHELKTPLALILMFSEMLSDGRVPSEEKKREYYGIINRESARLTQLIENILDFSRIEAGRKLYDLQPLDVSRVVRDVYENYRVDLDRRGFHHRLAVADALPKVDADPDAVAQAVVNLVSNAVKYSRDEKRLEIDVGSETRRGRHGVLISVTDSGIGIAPEERARLFDGFFRASDDRVRRVRGTGLGLSVVKHIVEAHNGCIDVESRLVKGSVFRIFLPESTATDGEP